MKTKMSLETREVLKSTSLRLTYNQRFTLLIFAMKDVKAKQATHARLGGEEAKKTAEEAEALLELLKFKSTSLNAAAEKFTL